MNNVKKYDDFKKVNEGVDDNYDYTSFMRPITPEVVREEVIKLINEFEGDVEGKEQMIEKFVKRFMFKLWGEIDYMSENHENDIYDIIDGAYN